MPRTRVPIVPKAPEEPTPAAEVNASEGAETPPVPVDLDVGDPDESGPPTENLKIVIQLRPPNAMVGVSQPGKDPHLVSLEMVNVQGLEQVLAQVPGIVALARERWELASQYPMYTRPAPPPRPATPPVTRARTASTGTARVAPPAEPAVESPRMF